MPHTKSSTQINSVASKGATCRCLHDTQDPQLLFTAQVNVPDGPYPAPFSTIYRGMAKIGTEGFGALPRYCGVLMLAFFLGGKAAAAWGP